jgi:hypothetical protein
VAYFCNLQNFRYNGNTYQPGQVIPDFGVGKYDDILLDRGDVGSDGQGTGIEDKIANQKLRRAEMWTNYDSMLREEENFDADYAKYDGDKEVESRAGAG